MSNSVRRRPGLRSIFRLYERELVCGRCRSVMAWIRLGWWRLMRIQHVGGYRLTPLGGEVAVRIVRTRLATAERDGSDLGPDAMEARRDLGYLRDEAGEIMYEVVCATCAAHYWRSLPHLASDVRAATAGRVTLG